MLFERGSAGGREVLILAWRRDLRWADAWGGDHAVLVWALHPQRVYHVYHHCSHDRWEEQLPEFRQILDSFELLDDPTEGDRS